MKGVISLEDFSEALTAFGVNSRTGSSEDGEDGEAATDWDSTGCTIPYRLSWGPSTFEASFPSLLGAGRQGIKMNNALCFWRSSTIAEVNQVNSNPSSASPAAEDEP
jgi:hypothetical protein